jgi:hypothetical protein
VLRYPAWLFGSRFIWLVRLDGALDPRVSVSRAQLSGVRATYQQADGAWVQVAADVARVVQIAGAWYLLIEGARTNANPNPRGEGFVTGVIGSGGSLPTGWVGTSLSGGAAATIVGSQTIAGVDCLLIRFAGTPNATIGRGIEFGPTDTVTAGTVLTNSLFVALTAGALTNVSPFTLRTNTEGGTVFTPNASLTRYTATRIMSNTAANTTLRWNYLDTVTAVDFTLALGWPQREMGASFASTPILPPVGTPGAAQRGADVVTAALQALGLPPSARAGIVADVLAPQVAPSGVDQMIWQVDGGDDGTRLGLRNAAGGATVLPFQTVGGSTTDGTSPGNLTALTRARVSAALDGAGRIAASLSGAAVRSQAGGPAGALTTLRLGNNQAGTAALFGYLGNVRVLPAVPGDGRLPALSA